MYFNTEGKNLNHVILAISLNEIVFISLENVFRIMYNTLSFTDSQLRSL